MKDFYRSNVSGEWIRAASDEKWLGAAKLAALDPAAAVSAALTCAVIALVEAVEGRG